MEFGVFLFYIRNYFIRRFCFDIDFCPFFYHRSSLPTSAHFYNLRATSHNRTCCNLPESKNLERFCYVFSEFRLCWCQQNKLKYFIYGVHSLSENTFICSQGTAINSFINHGYQIIYICLLEGQLF